MKQLLGVLLAFILGSNFVFAGGSKDAGIESVVQTKISVGGSTSVTPLMELFQAEYAKLQPNVSITVSGTGSGDGITGTASGIYDIGMSSRELRPAEIGTGLEPLVIAVDGIAIIVNKNNPILNLTIEQIRGIYTGAITRWEQLGEEANGKSGGISVISREGGSGTRDAFQELIGFSDANLISNVVILDGTGAIRSAVAGNPDTIGYISSGSVDESIMALKIEGVSPSVENIKNGVYKIARPFILITRKAVAPVPGAKAFLDWIMSAQGQAIVGRSWVRVN